MQAHDLIRECQAALAEELAAWDIDPPLHHVKQAHDRCVEWLAAHPAPVDLVAPKQCDAEACEQGCACPGDCNAEHRTPFDVAHGPRTVHGQIATGFVVGVRMPDLDVLVFGATVDETRRAAERLGGELFGESMIERRAMLVRESQSS